MFSKKAAGLWIWMPPTHLLMLTEIKEAKIKEQLSNVKILIKIFFSCFGAEATSLFLTIIPSALQKKSVYTCENAILSLTSLWALLSLIRF